MQPTDYDSLQLKKMLTDPAMNGLRIEGFAETDLPHVAEQLLTYFPQERLFALYGGMGVGKTTLVKAVCDCLGVSDNVCSPTFSIVNVYSTAEVGEVYHFDCYRLRRVEEACDIGCEEYFFSGNYCFVEWPELIEPLLPDSYVRVMLEEHGGLRSLSAKLEIL